MKKKMLIVFAGALVCLLALGSCSKKEEGKKTLNIASTMPVGSPAHLAMEKFEQDFEKATDGRYDVLIHPGSAMGGEKETFEMLEGGSVEVGVVATTDIQFYYPQYFVTDAPFLFRDEAHYWRYWDGPGKDLDALIEKEHGVRNVGLMMRGSRWLTANKPIHNANEIRGVKIRVPELQLEHEFWGGACGAVTSTIAFADLYMALKTGVVDAQENPPESIYSYKYYEAQKYLMPTRHRFSMNRFLISMKWLNSLSAADQKTFNDIMKAAIDYGKDLTKNGEEEYVNLLVSNGMEVVDIDITGFRAAGEKATAEFAGKNWVPGLYEQVKDL
jgi:tripartite ATP-independent transporter DctP family solute receptor